MTITPKERELVAIGISVAAGCKPCTDYHVKAAQKVRATGMREAVVESLLVRHRSADIMEAYALDRLDDQGGPLFFGSRSKQNRLGAMVSVGAAFATNCTSSLEHSLATAKAAGVSQDDIMQVVELAALIKRKAASHVEHLVGLTEEKTAV